MVLYGYDASTFNAISGSSNWDRWFDGIVKDPNKSNEYGAINTAYTVGAIVAGWFIGGPLADWGGRRVGMATGAGFVIIATFMQAFTPKGNIGIFIGGRVVVGLGQGLALTAGPAYINELAPVEIRGVIMTFWQMFYSVGSFIAYWVRYGCSQNAAKLGEWDWRMVVLFQLLMPIVILAQVFFIPETPRWYIQRGGQVDKARASLRRVRETEEEVETELLMIREAIEYEKEAISSGYSALWKDKSVRRRLLIAFALNAGQQVTGQGSLNTYSTIIYKRVFPGDAVDLINAINATLAILFTLNAMWTADRFGRKFLFIVGALGMGVCMLLVAIVGTETPFLDSNGMRTEDKLKGTKSRPVAIAIAFLLFTFSFFCKPPHLKRAVESLLISRANLICRQTLVGSHDVDMDLGSIQHERARASDRHGIADAEHSQLDRAAVLPDLPEQGRILLLLLVLRHQHAAGRVCVVRRARDQRDPARGDGCPVWGREPCG
jgi:MFS family permease